MHCEEVIGCFDLKKGHMWVENDHCKVEKNCEIPQATTRTL